MEEKKKSKKGLIAIIIILVILVIVAIIYFALRYFSGNKTTGTTWGDTYFAYLTEGLEQENDEERQKYGLQSGVEKAELQFIETGEEEEPVMLMSYDKDDKSYTNIYYINDRNSVSSVLNQEYSDAEYLYNINNKEYNWYLHSESDSTDSYTNVSNIINNQNQSEPEYVLDKNNKTEVELEDGNTVELSEFDKTFIKPDIEDNSKQEISIVDYVADDIVKKINSLVSNYDKESDKINEDVQNKVDGLVQVAEEAKQDQENSNNTQEETTQTESSTFKVGNYTLHYGTYKGTDGQYADGRGVVKWNVTIKLNQDGTYTLTSSDQTMQKNNSGTFEVSTLQGKDVIELSGGGLYIVDANDTLTLYAGSGKSFTYQE